MIDYPRCKTCKWWVREEDEPVDSPYGACALAATGEKAIPDGIGSRALAWGDDDRSHGAFLITHADFGCVQHEPRDDA